METEGKISEILNVHIRRGESVAEAVKRGWDKIGVDASNHFTKEIFTGYLYDPRQTDNAWVDGKAQLLLIEGTLDGSEYGSHTRWNVIDHKLINELYSTSGFLLRKGLKHIYDVGLVKEEFVNSIINKSG